MVDVTMSMEEYLTLLNGMTMESAPMPPEALETPKKKRSTAYQRKYKSNFKKIAPRYKLKSGKWKKNGFRLAVKEAHRMSRGTKKGMVRKTARRAFER
mgnify:CR=1 FL=1